MPECGASAQCDCGKEFFKGKKKPKRLKVCKNWFENAYSVNLIPTRVMAKEIGCSDVAINALAERFGIPRRPRLPRSIPHSVRDIDMNEVVRLYYEEMMPCDKIGEIFGMHGATIGKRLRKAGHKLRHHNDTKRGKPSNNRIDLDPEIVIEMYSERFASAQTVADSFGVSRQVIDRILRENGVAKKPMGEARDLRGEKHPLWRHDLSDEERENRRDETAQKAWRAKIFQRDGYTCQCCGDAKGGNLNAHHIVPHSKDKSIAWDLDNGITLCKPCHISFHMQYGYTNCTREDLEKYMLEVASCQQLK